MTRHIPILRITFSFLLLTLSLHCTATEPDAPPAEKISSGTVTEAIPDKSAPLSAMVSATATDIPSDIVLLLDNSGSMKTNDPHFLMADAVTQFVNQLDDNTRLGIVIFDQKVALAYPLTQVTDQSRTALLDSLKRINYRGQRTNSPDGLERALYELKLHAREDSERSIVFLTDGIVDTGNKQKDLIKAEWMRKELTAGASDNRIKIFGIAFTDNADFQLIQSLAQQTGAEYFRAFTANDIAGVFMQIQDQITAARQKALQAKIEASTPPPTVPEPSKPAAPPEPLIVEIPEPQYEEDKMTQYMLFGIAGLLILVLVIILLRARSTPARGTADPSSTMPNVQLLDMGNVTNRQSYTLTTKITQIGRIQGDEKAANVTYIIIPKKSISRHHAVIEYRNHDFWIMDQGSGNGTKLNHQTLTEERRLKHGDIITFDTYNFAFSEPEMDQSDATVIQAPSSNQTDPASGKTAGDNNDAKMQPDNPTGGTPETGKADTTNTPADGTGTDTKETDVSDMVGDISNWDFEEAEVESTPTQPPNNKTR